MARECFPDAYFDQFSLVSDEITYFLQNLLQVGKEKMDNIQIAKTCNKSNPRFGLTF